LQKNDGGMWSKEAWTWLKKRHQVEGPIMQAKEWMTEFERWNPWSCGHKGHKVKMSVLEKTEAREGTWPPRPVGLPLFKHPRCAPSAGKQLIQLSVCVQNHLRLSHPSQVCFTHQNTS
jgi:hypothetical protein